MEEDKKEESIEQLIEILEQYLKNSEIIEYADIKRIENLMAIYKELEEWWNIELEDFELGKESSRKRIEYDYIPKSKVKEKIEELEHKLKDVSKQKEKAKTKEEENILWCLEIRLDEKIKTLQDLLRKE